MPRIPPGAPCSLDKGLKWVPAFMQSLSEIECSWTWRPYLEEFVGGSPWTDPVILITSSLSCLICMCAVTPEDGKSPSFILTIATVNDIYDITHSSSTFYLITRQLCIISLKYLPLYLISFCCSGLGFQLGSQDVFPPSTSHFPQNPSITSFCSLTSVAHQNVSSFWMQELWTSPL